MTAPREFSLLQFAKASLVIGNRTMALSSSVRRWTFGREPSGKFFIHAASALQPSKVTKCTANEYLVMIEIILGSILILWSAGLPVPKHSSSAFAASNILEIASWTKDCASSSLMRRGLRTFSVSNTLPNLSLKASGHSSSCSAASAECDTFAFFSFGFGGTRNLNGFGPGIVDPGATCPPPSSAFSAAASSAICSPRKSSPNKSLRIRFVSVFFSPGASSALKSSNIRSPTPGVPGGADTAVCGAGSAGASSKILLMSKSSKGANGGPALPANSASGAAPAPASSCRAPSSPASAAFRFLLSSLLCCFSFFLSALSASPASWPGALSLFLSLSFLCFFSFLDLSFPSLS
mmetsp:Transcript_17790/g.50668  ORF Transcript_17790/g.50668 Transcript_17790/m.50668 type:complete len:350 (-) Transcript_17790:491-1540(-)